jgi:hypothetical protein
MQRFTPPAALHARTRRCGEKRRSRVAPHGPENFNHCCLSLFASEPTSLSSVRRHRLLLLTPSLSARAEALHGERGIQRPAHKRLVRRELLYPPARLQRPIVRQEGNATRATTNHRLHLAEWRRRAMALVVTGELGTLLFLGSIPLLSSLFISVYSTLPQFLVLSAIDPSYFCCRCRRARSLIRCDSIYVTKQTPHRASPL